MSASPWLLYDRLIAGVDRDLVVDDYMVGLGWTWVRSGDRVGVSATQSLPGRPRTHHGDIRGARLVEIAALVKSWNLVEASLGAAAVNCFHNTLEQVEVLAGISKTQLGPAGDEPRVHRNAFQSFADRLTGKKVVVVGHFPRVEEEVGDRCDLAILERSPSVGDYPDPASEYLIGEADHLFITGMTLVNKTLPRLLSLAGDRCLVCLVGPSVPISDVLFDLGVSNISGFCVTDAGRLDDLVRRGTTRGPFDAGVMVSVNSPSSLGTVA